MANCCASLTVSCSSASWAFPASAVNLPLFEQTIDAILGRYRAMVVPDITRPRIEAARIREIASSYRTVAHRIIEASEVRIAHILNMLPAGDERE